MSISFVQSKQVNSGGNATSLAGSLTSGVTNGNLLVASVGTSNNTATITGPSGWTRVTFNQPAGTNAHIETSIWYAIVGSGGISAGQTSWTWSIGASTTVYIAIEEWHSTTSWPSNPVDVSANGDTSASPTQSTTIQSGTTGTTAQSTELWVASLAYRSSAQTESSITAGWTKDVEATISGKCTMTMLYKVASSTGTAACQYTIGTAEYWAGCVATFKPTSNTPVLATSPTTMTFAAVAGGGNPASQNDTLSEINGYATAWTSNISYGSGSGWLAISPTSGSLTGGANAPIGVSCTTGALTAGTYTATITFTATTGGATATIPVTFNVSSATTTFTLVQSRATASSGSVTSLSGSLLAGITNGNLIVATVSCSNYAAKISGPAGWSQSVINHPNRSSANDEMSIWWMVAGAGQAGQTSWTWTIPSSHYMYICIEEWNASTGWPANPVDQTARGNIAITPTKGTTISSGATALTTQAAELWIAGLMYNDEAQTESSLTSGWTEDLEVTDSSSKHTAAMLYQTVNSTGVAGVSFTIGDAEHWAGAITTFAANAVTLNATLLTNPLILSYVAVAGGADPSPQTETISETSGAATDWTSSISYVSGSGWLSVAPSSGHLLANGTFPVSVSCTTGALASGIYTASVTFTATTSGAIVTFLVTFTVSPAPLNITIGDTVIGAAGGSLYFLEDTFQIQYQVGQRWQATFTVIDQLGTTWFTYRDLVIIQDVNLGVLFTGFMSNDTYDKQNTYPDVSVEHKVTCMDLWGLLDKRTSNLSYTTPTTAGKIVIDMADQVLSSEGVVAHGVVQTTTSQADWAAGTLSNVSATSNIDAGDLELALGGSTATQHELIQSSWSANGTLSNVTANSGGDLSLHGSTRNWDNGSTSKQTLYGNGSPTQSVNSSKQLVLTCKANSETRSRLDFAGTWANFTATIDMGIGGIVPYNSITYRTTGWSNNDGSYAYAIEFNEATISLRKGSNGGANSSSAISTHTFSPQLSAGTYTVLLVISGSSHQIYVNGTRYINATDGTYTSAGYLAIRNRNTEAYTLTQTYDNFGVMAATSGTWTGNSVSVNSITTVASSIITWGTSLSAGGTVNVQATTNGGSTWTNCANGGSIPGLAKGASGTGKSLQVRVQLSTGSAATMPDINSLSWTVAAGYQSTGTRTSGPFDLSSVGQCGSTFIGWNANLPTNTSLTVQASPDNSTWYDVTAQNGGSLPWIDDTPDPTTDGFETDTSTNYTSTSVNGITSLIWLPFLFGRTFLFPIQESVAGTWAFDTANSRVSGIGGYNAVLYSDLVQTQNVSVATIMDQSNSGGLIFDMVDQNNCYIVVVADSMSSNSTPNTITLYKVVSGSYTTLGNATINFTRGTYHIVEATMQAGTITVTFDGSVAITYVDSTPLAAGYAGLYNNGGGSGGVYGGGAYGSGVYGSESDAGSRYYYLWIQPQGDSLSGQVVYTKQILSTSDTTVTPQVLDLTVAAFGPQIDTGATLPSASYVYTFCDKNLDDLARQSNYECWIDQNYILNFNAREGQLAPWVLQSNSLGIASDIEIDSNLQVDLTNDQYRNRQVLTNVINSGAFTDTFVGDGSRTSFTLRYPIAPGTVPSVTLDTLTQKVGTKGATARQWYYASNDATIAQDSSGAVLTAGDTLSISYTGLYSDTVIVDNLAAQATLSNIDDTTGIVESVEDVSQKQMSYAAGLVYAQALLDRYCIVDNNNNPTGRTLQFKTYRSGLFIGQLLPCFLPELNLQDVFLLIHQIQVGMQVQPNNTVLYNYLVTASELPKTKTFPALLAEKLLQ